MKKIATLCLLFILLGSNLHATHIRGGYIAVQSEKAGTKFKFTVVLHLYTEYHSDLNIQIPPDETATVGLYKANSLMNNIDIPEQQSRLYYGCFGDTFYHTTYKEILLLDSIGEGYILQYSRCCRENMPQVIGSSGNSSQPLGFYATLPCIHGFISPEPDFPVIVNTVLNSSIKQELAFTAGSGYDSSSIKIRAPFGGPATENNPLPLTYPSTLNNSSITQKSGFTDVTPLGAKSQMYISNNILTVDFVDSNDGFGSLEQILFLGDKEIFKSNIELVFYTDEQLTRIPDAGQAFIGCNPTSGVFDFSATVCPQTYPPVKIYLYQTLDTSGNNPPSDSCLYNPNFTFTGATGVRNYFRLSYSYPGQQLWYTKWVGIQCWNAGTGEISTENKLQVFPNPAQNLLYFRGEFIPKEVALVSVSGQTVVVPVKDKHADISGLSRGLYFLRAGNTIQKIVLD